MARLLFTHRRRWNNYVNNQGADPLEIVQPTSVAEVIEVVRRAERTGVTVRAVGEGHSWSDVALTAGIVLDTGGIAGPLELEGELLHGHAMHERLVRVGGGMSLESINDHLDGQGLALPNMSGYDGMTIAGVTSTSTHGSGIEFGPLPEYIRSLDLVAGGGRLLRIERADGPTDPDKWRARHPDHQLVQDDQWFRAAVVGLGSMGVIVGLILAVDEKYYLREVRTMTSWDQVREDLLSREVLRRHRHYDVLINPYAVDGVHRCIVTTRDPISAEEYSRDWHRTRHLLSELLASTPIFPFVVNLIAGLFPALTPKLINFALSRLEDADYSNVSYRVLNIGAVNGMPAISAEIAVPLDAEGTHVLAVERFLAIAAQRAELGNVYEMSPVALRFVRASDAYLSMMNGRDTMTMEMISMTHTVGGYELLAAYEDGLYELGGRPHWGQINTLNESRVAALYPELQQWLAIRRELDPTGVFDSPFTKRVGLSAYGVRVNG